MQTKKFILVVVMLMALGLSACAGVAAAQGPTPTPATPPPGAAGEQPRTITVSGSGKATMTPDIAYINIGVHTEGEDAAEAVAANSTQTQEVTDALRAAGIAAQDIQTTNFSIWPNQQYDPQGQPTGKVRYMVDNTVFVTLRNLEDIGDVLDAAVQAGANSINGIQFDVADKTSALSDARKSAVADARTVAEELAEAAGVELGQIQNISVYGGGYPVPMFDGRGGGVAMEQAASVPVTPGQMILTVEVSLTYSIR